MNDDARNLLYTFHFSVVFFPLLFSSDTSSQVHVCSANRLARVRFINLWPYTVAATAMHHTIAQLCQAPLPQPWKLGKSNPIRGVGKYLKSDGQVITQGHKWPHLVETRILDPESYPPDPFSSYVPCSLNYNRQQESQLYIFLLSVTCKSLLSQSIQSQSSL